MRSWSRRTPVALMVTAAVALTGCEPLLLREDPAAGGAATTSPSPSRPTGRPDAPASRSELRKLSPQQLAAMSQARTSVSDGDIMRALADRAERIAQRGDFEPAPPPASISPGSNRALGYHLMIEFGWGAEQWPALDALWQRESGWNHLAQNRSSGAYGIPQSLPAGKMASVGSDWRTNPETQIRWGLAYIAARYGTPTNAWAHSERVGWY